MSETVHVMPTWEEHNDQTLELSEDKILSLCQCNPRIEYKEGSVPLIIHHAIEKEEVVTHGQEESSRKG